jgi:hypothetical protein
MLCRLNLSDRLHLSENGENLGCCWLVDQYLKSPLNRPQTPFSMSRLARMDSMLTSSAIAIRCFEQHEVLCNSRDVIRMAVISSLAGLNQAAMMSRFRLSSNRGASADSRLAELVPASSACVGMPFDLQ